MELFTNSHDHLNFEDKITQGTKQIKIVAVSQDVIFKLKLDRINFAVINTSSGIKFRSLNSDANSLFIQMSNDGKKLIQNLYPSHHIEFPCFSVFNEKSQFYNNLLPNYDSKTKTISSVIGETCDGFTIIHPIISKEHFEESLAIADEITIQLANMWFQIIDDKSIRAGFTLRAVRLETSQTLEKHFTPETINFKKIYVGAFYGEHLKNNKNTSTLIKYDATKNKELKIMLNGKFIEYSDGYDNYLFGLTDFSFVNNLIEMLLKTSCQEYLYSEGIIENKPLTPIPVKVSGKQSVSNNFRTHLNDKGKNVKVVMLDNTVSDLLYQAKKNTNYFKNMNLNLLCGFKISTVKINNKYELFLKINIHEIHQLPTQYKSIDIITATKMEDYPSLKWLTKKEASLMWPIKKNSLADKSYHLMTKTQNNQWSDAIIKTDKFRSRFMMAKSITDKFGTLKIPIESESIKNIIKWLSDPKNYEQDNLSPNLEKLYYKSNNPKYPNSVYVGFSFNDIYCEENNDKFNKLEICKTIEDLHKYITYNTQISLELVFKYVPTTKRVYVTAKNVFIHKETKEDSATIDIEKMKMIEINL
jgi:hypothetical protein